MFAARTTIFIGREARFIKRIRLIFRVPAGYLRVRAPPSPLCRQADGGGGFCGWRRRRGGGGRLLRLRGINMHLPRATAGNGRKNCRKAAAALSGTAIFAKNGADSQFFCGAAEQSSILRLCWIPRQWGALLCTGSSKYTKSDLSVC